MSDNTDVIRETQHADNVARFHAIEVRLDLLEKIDRLDSRIAKIEGKISILLWFVGGLVALQGYAVFMAH